VSGARHGRSGTVAERRAGAALEAEGYLVTRAAGSLGLFDLVAVGLADVRLVQVKYGDGHTNGRTIGQYRAIAALTVAPFVRKEVWIYRARARAPEVHALGDAAALAAWRGRKSRRAERPALPLFVSSLPGSGGVPRTLPPARDGGGTPAGEFT
jgi:hypothetical protein